MPNKSKKIIFPKTNSGFFVSQLRKEAHPMGIFKDENGRSYGDWSHRGQGRTRENANQIATHDDEGPKWYNQTFWIIFFLVVIWPVGLVLMWRSACTWKTPVKVIVTIVLAFVVILSYQMSQAVLAAQGTIS